MKNKPFLGEWSETEPFSCVQVHSSASFGTFKLQTSPPTTSAPAALRWAQPAPERQALSHARTRTQAREQESHSMGSEAACAFTRNAAFWGNVTDQNDPRDAPTENNTRARTHTHGRPPPTLRSRVPLDQISELARTPKVISRHAHRQPAELARFGCTRPQQHVRSGSDMFTTTRASRTPMRQRRRACSKLDKKTRTRTSTFYTSAKKKKAVYPPKSFQRRISPVHMESRWASIPTRSSNPPREETHAASALSARRRPPLFPTFADFPGIFESVFAAWVRVAPLRLQQLWGGKHCGSVTSGHFHKLFFFFQRWGDSKLVCSQSSQLHMHFLPQLHVWPVNHIIPSWKSLWRHTNLACFIFL